LTYLAPIKKPLPTARQIPTTLKAGFAAVSTSPAAELVALALAPVALGATLDVDKDIAESDAAVA
jgi:hypothetical protein